MYTICLVYCEHLIKGGYDHDHILMRKKMSSSLSNTKLHTLTLGLQHLGVSFLLGNLLQLPFGFRQRLCIVLSFCPLIMLLRLTHRGFPLSKEYVKTSLKSACLDSDPHFCSIIPHKSHMQN